MFKTERTPTPGTSSLSLTSAITESTDFTADLPADVKELHVYCKDVSRINSMGITKWILFFRDLRKKGVAVKYFDVGVPVVNLCNFVAGMVEKDEVQSLFMPYFCENCNSESERLITVKELQACNFEVTPSPCPNCKSPTEFDGVPAHYFDFLKD